jgi:hypothetical protein
MSSKATHFLKKTLGEDFESSLQKFELYKPGTRTVTDHEEIRTALQIVPRAVMSFLIRELAPMNIGESKELKIPVEQGATLYITKMEHDVYNGKIAFDDNNVATKRSPVDILYRSIPGVGLIILSTFELYDVDQLEEKHPEVTEDISISVQKLVDERLALHSLIGQVVDKKLMEKDAIQQLVLAKLTQVMEKPKTHDDLVNQEIKKNPELEEPKKEEPQKPKGSPLREFLDKRKKKPKEFHVQMMKSETVNCPDCGQSIFKSGAFAGCVCMGDSTDKKVYIKKSEDGIKIRFGRGWDPETIEMLLETLWRRNGNR